MSVGFHAIAPQRSREQPNLRIKTFFNLAKVLTI